MSGIFGKVKKDENEAEQQLLKRIFISIPVQKSHKEVYTTLS